MSKSESWHRDTALIRSGIYRTGHQETSEALFMTSGYVYGTAEEAAAAFKNETDNFVYIQQTQPLPMSVTALFPQLNTYDG